MTNGSGPIYDDGCIQIACKIELRASQCRLSFFYRNHSTAGASNFSLVVTDKAELTRFEAAKVTSPDVPAGSQGQLLVMMECMKPAAPGPTLTVHYIDSAVGERNNVIQLPIAVTTFNEAIANLNGADFVNKWGQLTAQPGQELQEVLKPTNPIRPPNILQAFTGVSIVCCMYTVVCKCVYYTVLYCRL